MTVQLSEDEYQALQLGAELDDIRKPNTITSNILGRINSLSYETKLLTASMEHQGTSGSQAQDADSNPMPAGGGASSAGQMSACLTLDQGGLLFVAAATSCRNVLVRLLVPIKRCEGAYASLTSVASSPLLGCSLLTHYCHC